MLKVSISSLRDKNYFQKDEVLVIVNSKKKEKIGYFIPVEYENQIKDIIDSIEKKKKKELLKRVAEAQKEDSIGDGTVADGI